MTLTDNDEAGKLFVGGLSWETTKENLQKYFSRYGEVVDSVVMKNGETGRSRGFGFITFKDATCVSIVLSTGPHELDGRTIDPKACTPRSLQQKGRKSDNYGKIFLGGLPANITETEIRSAFSKYGKVIDVVIMYDQEKKRSRGFGFLSFDSEDSIQQACMEHYVNINGKQIECKRAEPRDLPRRGGGGGRGQQFHSNQWNSGGMNQGQSWGAPASAGPAPPAANGMMPGGYQPMWGAPQPAQQPPTFPNPQAGGYNSGYQNWNAPSQSGYSSSYPATSAPYNQPTYQNYGAAPAGYNYNAPSAAPPQGASDPNYGQGSQAPPSSDTSANPSTNYGLGAYSQDTSSYGPAKSYTAPASNTQGYGNTPDYGSSASYGASSTQAPRAQAQAPAYHPYRR